MSEVPMYAYQGSVLENRAKSGLVQERDKLVTNRESSDYP